METIPLGTRVKDCVTSFIGIAICRVIHLTGCDQYGVQGFNEVKGERDTQYFDVTRLDVIDEGVSVRFQVEESAAEEKPKGGPQVVPPSSSAIRQ